MITGRTEDGFEFEIDENKLDDFEFLEALEAMRDEDALSILKAMRILYGEETLAKAKAFVKAKKGYVSTAEMSKLFSEVVNAIGGKKS